MYKIHCLWIVILYGKWLNGNGIFIVFTPFPLEIFSGMKLSFTGIKWHNCHCKLHLFDLLIEKLRWVERCGYDQKSVFTLNLLIKLDICSTMLL